MNRTVLTEKLDDETRHRLHATMTILSHWDIDVFTHGVLVALAMVELAPIGQTETWYWAGLFHDVGKITLPLTLLNKPGALDPGEQQRMRQHSVRGAQILTDLGAPRTSVDAARFHHERWDGTGYPCGIGGLEIPLVARAVALVDTYAALTSDRPYRRAFTPAQARLQIERHAGTQFDPEAVERFLASLKDEGWNGSESEMRNQSRQKSSGLGSPA